VGAPKISVIMASYKRADALDRCLRSLSFWPSRRHCEVVISDDNSPNVAEIAAVVARYRPAMRITFVRMNAALTDHPWFYQERLPNGEHYNSATMAYNVSLRHAVGAVFMLSGFDLIHVKDNIGYAVERYWAEQDPARTRLVLVGTEYESNAAGAAAVLGNWIDPQPLLTKRLIRKHLVSQRRPRLLLHVGCVARELVYDIGGMNEHLSEGFAFSDKDFGDRLSMAGAQVEFTDRVAALHPLHERPEFVYETDPVTGQRMSQRYQINRAIHGRVVANRTIRPNEGYEWGSERTVLSVERW